MVYMVYIYTLYIWYGYILTWGNQCHKQLPFGDSVICTIFFLNVIWGMVYYWVHHIIMIFDAHLFDISHHWDTADNWLIITVLRMIDIQYIHYIYMYVYIHIQHYTKQHVHTCTWYATKPLQRFELLWDMLISFYHVYIYIYTVYTYIIYIYTYTLCTV